MIFRITKVSTYAMQILQNNTVGSVHSVYRNTVNILVNDHLLALQTAGSPFSPISLITDLDTDEFARANVEEGQTISLDYTDATVVNLSPEMKIPHKIRHELYKKFSHIIQASNTGGFDLIFQISPNVDKDLVLTVAETKIHMANTLFHKEQYEEASRIISELVGLGIGLTPSGDDFLCGILAGFQIQGKEHSHKVSYLREAIREKLSRTNEISRAFLVSAIEGHFSQAINELWNNPDEETIAKMFGSIGHSSGMDTLCGIYYLFFLME